MSDFLDEIYHCERDFFVRKEEEEEVSENQVFQSGQEQQCQHELVSQQQMQQPIDPSPTVRDFQEQKSFSQEDLFDHLKMMDERSSQKILCFKCLCRKCQC